MRVWLERTIAGETITITQGCAARRQLGGIALLPHTYTYNKQKLTIDLSSRGV